MRTLISSHTPVKTSHASSRKCVDSVPRNPRPKAAIAELTAHGRVPATCPIG